MNRVVENLRSHLDAVVIHIGSHELTDAAHSIGPATSRAGVASVAGSVATVTSRQVREALDEMIFLYRNWHAISVGNKNGDTKSRYSVPHFAAVPTE